MPVSTDRTLRRIYDLLFSACGPRHWWPAKSSTEVAIGAILTQNTAWAGVEQAIANLEEARCLTWPALDDVPVAQLAELIRPAGTYRVKAKRVKALVAAVVREFGGTLATLESATLDDARNRLLRIHGIGPETADAILLYACKRPTFVIDAYTRRILRRHLLLDADGSADYHEVQTMFHAAMAPNAQRYNEYHALLVKLGKTHCRVRARCDHCPLADLPHEPDR